MKRIFAIVVTLVMCLTVVACSSGGNPVEKYINDNKAELTTSFESSFEGSGLTCETDIYAKGNGMVIDVKINEFEDLDDATKDLLQETYDGMGSVFGSALDEMQTEIPELESLTINVCEKDGDVCAVIKAD